MPRSYCFYRKGEREEEISYEELYDYVEKKLLEFMEDKTKVVDFYIDLLIVSITTVGDRALEETNFVPLSIEPVEKHLPRFFKDNENLKELALKLLYKEFDYSSSSN